MSIPPRVLDGVKRQLATLAVLVRARETDSRFGGNGRYEAEAFLNHRRAVDQAWAYLTSFEALCVEQGADAAAVYAELGQPPRLSPAAGKWLTAQGVALPLLAESVPESVVVNAAR